MLNEKENRLEELKELKEMLISSLHELLVGEANFKKDIIEKLIHKNGIWCPRLPSSRMRKLIKEAWETEDSAAMPPSPMPELSLIEGDSPHPSSASSRSDSASLASPSAESSLTQNSSLKRLEFPEGCRCGCPLSSNKKRISTLLSSDWCVHRHDINTPFLINEMYGFANQ